jgi:hypothetical protein
MYMRIISSIFMSICLCFKRSHKLELQVGTYYCILVREQTKNKKKIQIYVNYPVLGNPDVICSTYNLLDGSRAITTPLTPNSRYHYHYLAVSLHQLMEDTWGKGDGSKCVKVELDSSVSKTVWLLQHAPSKWKKTIG